MYWKGLPLSSAKITKDKHRILFRQVTLHFHILYKSSERWVQKKEFYSFFLLNRTLYPNIKKRHKKARSISIILYSNHFLIKKPRRITPGLKNKTLKFRSCFKFIPRQIETHVEADWSPRYAVNSGLLTKIKGFKMRDRGSTWPEHTCLKW